MASRCHEKLHGVNDTAEPDSGEVGTVPQSETPGVSTLFNIKSCQSITSQA